MTFQVGFVPHPEDHSDEPYKRIMENRGNQEESFKRHCLEVGS